MLKKKKMVYNCYEKLEHFDDETSMSLLHIMPRFEEENIDFQVFLALTEDDMKELGLKMGDRKRISMAQAYFLSSQYSGEGVNVNAEVLLAQLHV